MLTESDRLRVGAAVTRAEQSSDGEIVTVVAESSDSYDDIVTLGGVLASLLLLALVATIPAAFVGLLDRVAGGWSGWTPRELMAILLVAMAATFLVARWLLGRPALRRHIVPATTATRRVRRRALLLFRLSAENRTRARTGVLLYLSLAEHRAEIVADASIASRVTPDTWGAAMAALVDAVRDDRPADGMVAAVEAIGAVLAEHFPRSADDTNELPDRLILL